MQKREGFFYFRVFSVKKKKNFLSGHMWVNLVLLTKTPQASKTQPSVTLGHLTSLCLTVNDSLIISVVVVFAQSKNVDAVLILSRLVLADHEHAVKERFMHSSTWKIHQKSLTNHALPSSVRSKNMSSTIPLHPSNKKQPPKQNRNESEH